jgi:hypothetical protein
VKQSNASISLEFAAQPTSIPDGAISGSEGPKKGFAEVGVKNTPPSEPKLSDSSVSSVVVVEDKKSFLSPSAVKSKTTQDHAILVILDNLNAKPLLINANSDDNAFVASLPESVKGALNAVPDVSTFTADVCTVAMAIEVSKRINEVLDAANLYSDDVSLGIRVLMLKRIINAVRTAASDNAVYILGYLIGCVMRGNDSLGEEAWRYILSRSPLCWPSLEAVEGVLSAPLPMDANASYAVLMGCMLLRGEDMKVVGIEEGWSWMVRIGKRLNKAVIEIQKPDVAARAELEKAFNIGCAGVLGFLRQTWRLWAVKFGRSSLDSVARALASVCSKATAISNVSKSAQALNTFLSGLLAMDSNFSEQHGKQSALQTLPIKLQSR